MPVDLLSLLRRDHADLQADLLRLLDLTRDPAAEAAELRSGIDGVRLGLIAHAEAEDIVLGRLEVVRALDVVLATTRAAHHAQEAELAALVSTVPGTPRWRERAQRLHDLVVAHDHAVGLELGPALRTHAPPGVYARLAGAFATERLRLLAMLQPSAPIVSLDAGPEVANLGS